MSRRKKFVLALLVVFGCAALALLGFAGARALAPAVAHAQATSSTSPTTTGPTTTASATGGDRRTAGLLVALGAFALILVYLFLWGWMRGVVTLSKASVAAGLGLPDYELNVAETAPVTAKGIGEPPSLKIVGPPAVTVGQPAKFSAQTAEGPAANCTWSVDADRASVAPTTGAETVVIAKKPGPFTLKATAGGAPATATVVAVNTGDARRGALPIIGVGYAGLTIAIIAVTGAAALTALRIFPAAALSTLLGTVVSYFFLRRDGHSGGSSDSGGASGGASGTTEG